MVRRRLPSASTGRGARPIPPTETFIELTDTPASYAGAGLKFVTVTAGETGLEFTPLPPLAITDTFVVASEAAMLALTAQRGDVAIRTDINQTFILTADDPSILGNWALLLVSPTHAMGGALHTADTMANLKSKISAPDILITSQAAEISTLTAKATPAAADLFIIEDSADTNKKKSVSLSALPILLKVAKITVSHIDFQTAALTKSNTLFTLPAGAIVIGSRLKASAIFTGGAIANYFLSIGITGAEQDLMTEYDARNITPAADEYAEASIFQSFNFSATVDLKITARSVTANLDASTGGAADIEIFYIIKT